MTDNDLERAALHAQRARDRLAAIAPKDDATKPEGLSFHGVNVSLRLGYTVILTAEQARMVADKLDERDRLSKVADAARTVVNMHGVYVAGDAQECALRALRDALDEVGQGE